MVFDNSKISTFVPGFNTRITFAEGIRRSLNWLNEDPDRKVVDPKRDAEIDTVVKVWKEKFEA
jgi:hypothetical protein